MTDSRITQLASILVSHSVKVSQGEKVWIKLTSFAGLELAKEVYKQVVQAGGVPHLDIGVEQLSSFFYREASDAQLAYPPQIAEFLARWADKSITIVADQNTRELADAPVDRIMARSKLLKPIRDISIKKPWVLVYAPTPAMAQDAGMSLEAFEDFFFDACNRDWSKDVKKLKNLADLLSSCSTVQIIGEHTNLSMKTKGRVWIPCAGEYNMPDGEVFTAPQEDTVEGHVFFEYPLLRQGKVIRDIQLWFEKGQVVRAQASDNLATLEAMLDTDAGARRLGEIAIGMNPMIQRYMYNTLFDEKMAGTVHMALGQAYEECNGTNTSAIHVDIVKEMKTKGSQVIADDRVIMQDGVIAL